MSQVRVVKAITTFVVPEVKDRLKKLARKKKTSLYRLVADILEDASIVMDR
jgi:hypothetical protein